MMGDMGIAEVSDVKKRCGTLEETGGCVEAKKNYTGQKR